ncbi:MAG TPA: 6-pyruvoyl-tetrahydropterin synthase-related protein [Blastocatellia bacterium]|nr:6-pyruvoyl-tetrahydropterin synthase-related protein [Blastocatellia bacterium]
MLRSTLRSRLTSALIPISALTISTVAVIPFYFSRLERVPGSDRVLRLIDTHDLWMHLYVVEQFDKVLRSGVIYPRWIPDINRGYGILNMIYYPPGFFYLSSAVHVVVDDWIHAMFVISTLSLAGSGLALYFLARTFNSKPASIVAALVYMLIPFHMLDLYWRGALPQFVGYVFLPLIVYFTFKLGKQGRGRYYAGLGLTFGLYVLTHLPVALLLTYALGFYGLVWAVKERNHRIALRIAAGVSLGLLLGAIYWLPAAAEAKYAWENATTRYPYHNSYITLLPIIEGSAYFTFWKLLNEVFVAHVVALAAPGLVLFALPKPRAETIEAQRPHENPGRHEWPPDSMWLLMSIAAVFMCTSLSIYLSKLLPEIQVAVPAWRWLAIASVFTALLAAACVDRLRDYSQMSSLKVWGYRSLFLAGLGVVLWVTVHGTIIGALSNQTYHPKADVVAELIEPNWTPRSASRPQDLPDTPPVVIEPTGGSSEIISWQPESRRIAVKVDVPSEVRLKTYNFPGWTAQIDGQPAPISSDSDGIQILEVQPGVHKIEVFFKNTPPRTLGAVLTATATLVIAALLGFESFQKRRRQPA